MIDSNGKPFAEPPDFETALARLEAIVREMESGSLSLDRMMACFEEGMRLAAWCDKKLNEVEKKIEILVKEAGTLRTEPFDIRPDANGTGS
ncbi:MAG: exodeoxyribonuclease VII small subunit [Kiritimatiellae bacterium]|nr:exodeoxyribonuclease VII small subunit [Kiritimatiellia bacterium]MDW8458533.1 exodeoxyribonuclease VII small subunit [Verrucomicrobiota bacterium]